MKPSTAAELVGFACLVAACALLWGAVGGLIAAGVSLLLIGYATEDQLVALSVQRMTMPISNARQKHRTRKENRRARRDARPRQPRHQPAQLDITVRSK